MRLTEERTRRKNTRALLKSYDCEIIGQGFFKVKAPPVFAITADISHRKRVLAFISRLREACATRKKVVISFAKTETMHTCGTLLFYSELRNIVNTNTNGTDIRVRRSQNTKVMEVLKQIGLLSLLRYNNNINPSFDDVVRWKFTTGNNVTASKYDEIVSALDEYFEDEIRQQLFKAFSEAMTNTHHHAYIEKDKARRIAEEEESWWAFSQVRDGLLHIVFCDLGIGIPGSLPRQQPDWVTDITARFGAGDAQTIQGAVHKSRTRTGQENRGNGLKQLVEAIKAVDAGYLSILSRKGGYRFEVGQEHTFNYHDSIGGTLVEWKLPLPKARGHSDETQDH